MAGRSVTLIGETEEEDSEWPNATTTGATSTESSMIAVTGNVTLNTPGQTYEGRYVRGQIRVTAANVTIRNCIIDFRAGANSHGINTTAAGATSTLIEDVEIFCPMDGTNNLTIGVYGSNWTARRLHVHHCWADAFRPVNNCTLEDSYVHSLGDVDSLQHADAVQMLIGINFTATGNNFEIPNTEEPEDKPPGSFMNSAGFMIQAFNGPVDNVLIENNRINGGDFGVQFTGGVTNGRVRNNTFGRETLYGPWATNVTNSASQLCGNVWEDTGLHISGNSACTV